MGWEEVIRGAAVCLGSRHCHQAPGTTQHFLTSLHLIQSDGCKMCSQVFCSKWIRHKNFCLEKRQSLKTQWDMIFGKNGMSKIYWDIVPIGYRMPDLSEHLLCLVHSWVLPGNNYLRTVALFKGACKVHGGVWRTAIAIWCSKSSWMFYLCFPDASFLNLKDADEDNSSRVFFHNNDVAVSNLDFSSNALQGLPTGRRFFLSLMETVSHPSTSKLRKPSMIPPSVL